ncbi:MAG: hypothetical protein ACYC8V_01520 [Caulobacteraceae bacterium]
MAVLQHELQHILDYRAGRLTALRYLIDPREWVYRFDLSRERDWGALGAEQRASMAEALWLAERGLGAASALTALKRVIPWAAAPISLDVAWVPLAESCRDRSVRAMTRTRVVPGKDDAAGALGRHQAGIGLGQSLDDQLEQSRPGDLRRGRLSEELGPQGGGFGPDWIERTGHRGQSARSRRAVPSATTGLLRYIPGNEAGTRSSAGSFDILDGVQEGDMGRAILLLLLGVPIPIIILLALIWH